MYARSTSPYRPKSPYNPPAPQAQSAPSISPGTITYTTSAGPDGRTVYQPFKAVAASYQTPNGIVHGIQWVPAEATQILPAGAQPATQDFVASWERGGYNSNEQTYMQDWQREEEKRRRKKEKEEAKAHERRRSGASASVGFPSPNPGNYPTSPNPSGYPTSPYVGTTSSYTSRDRKPSYGDLSGQFNDLGIGGRPRKYSTSEGAGPPVGGGYGSPPYGAVSGPYSKPYAATGPHISAYSNPSPNMRAADVLPSSGPPAGYPTSPYTSTKPSEPIARAPSPYGYGQPPRSRATTPIPSVPAFPQPRSRAASPVPGYAQPRSRAASPMPGGMPLPPEASFDRHNQPSVPECFSRPMNTALSFPAFDPIKIQEMDEFLERLPKLPLVLQSHDVTHHDWIRLTQDLSLTWSGKMPVPPERAANPPKRANVVAELLHAWNSAFFMPRGAEVVLYKGSTRFSGSKAGITDLPNKYDEDDSDDSDSSSEESSEDERAHNPQPVGLYGNAYPVPMAPSSAYSSESSEARRRRREERKRRRKEKRMKRKQREREKKYSLYVTYKPTSPMPGGYPAPRPGGY